jgi:hypothetical protein
MTATLIQSPDRVVLHNMSWQSYQSLISEYIETSLNQTSFISIMTLLLALI